MGRAKPEQRQELLLPRVGFTLPRALLEAGASLPRLLQS